MRAGEKLAALDPVRLEIACETALVALWDAQVAR
jgi:hypothetical protein